MVTVVTTFALGLGVCDWGEGEVCLIGPFLSGEGVFGLVNGGDETRWLYWTLGFGLWVWGFGEGLWGGALLVHPIEEVWVH